MKDNDGLYYYPFPNNKRVRMYVSLRNDEICFRLWNQDDDGLWEEHGWVPWEAILQAKKMYDGKKFDPNAAYDIRVATALIEDDS
jgi:hypothetical protein